MDTQEYCHPQLTVNMHDLQSAKKLAKKLKDDKTFYEHQSEVAKNNYNTFFGEKEYTYSMNKVMKEVINENN